MLSRGERPRQRAQLDRARPGNSPLSCRALRPIQSSSRRAESPGLVSSLHLLHGCTSSRLYEASTGRGHIPEPAGSTSGQTAQLRRQPLGPKTYGELPERTRSIGCSARHLCGFVVRDPKLVNRRQTSASGCAPADRPGLRREKSPGMRRQRCQRLTDRTWHLGAPSESRTRPRVTASVDMDDPRSVRRSNRQQTGFAPRVECRGRLHQRDTQSRSSSRDDDARWGLRGTES